MANINATEAYQEALSLAFEDRSDGYQDLVSNGTVILHEMKKRGGWTPYSGPNIRETLLFGESGTYVRHAGYDVLNPLPADLFNDAVFVPKSASVAVSMPMDQILDNAGSNQIKDRFKAHMKAAETELTDRFVEDLHSAGTETNQIGGLQMAVPTTVTNDYGGISRNTYTIWRTTTYDAQSAFSGISTVSSTTVKSIFNQIVIAKTRGRESPNLILCSTEHFLAYTAAVETIQRVTDNTDYSALGFTNLKFYGANKSIDIVLEGGIGTAMPANTSYFLKMDTLKFRYNPERNFVPWGGKRSPVNQDAVVQYIGFRGNLTMNNSLFNAKLYDSTP
jgi:hypothetical protein